MKSVFLFVALAAWPAIALAQYGSGSANSPSSSYQPAVPQAPATAAYGGYPGYYGGGGGGTAAGSALNGMGNVISSMGNYNLATSAAAVNMTQAQRNEIENHMEFTKTYFQMKEVNQAYKKSQQKPPLTQAQLKAIAQRGLPKPLDATQRNPETGTINWPALLREDPFADNRTVLDELSVKQVSYGQLGYSDQTKALDAAKSILAQLKGQIRDIPANDFLSSKNFVQSVAYLMSGSCPN